MTESVLYVHPGSPKNGEQWMKERIRFDEVKISRENEGNSYTCTLKTRYKYEPRIHIMKVVRLMNGEINESRVKTASFPFTQFITVKHYRNKELNQLRNRVRHHEPKSDLPQGVPPPGVNAPGVPTPGVPHLGVPPPGVPAPGVPAHGVPAHGVPAHGVPAPGVPATNLPWQPWL